MTHTHEHLHMQGLENKKVLWLSFFTSIFLFLGKSIVGFFSGSAALLASSVDNLIDSMSTLINMFFLSHASAPADKEHPFGHGKFEAFSGLIQGSIIVMLSLSLLVYSVSQLFVETEKNTTFELLGMFVVILSIVAPFLLARFIKSQAEKSHSLVLEAEHSHFFADGIMNSGVLLGLIISYFFGVSWVDSVIGIIISFWLIWGIKGLLHESFQVLVDAELPEKTQKKIQKILDASLEKKEISGWHALRTRRSGSEYHIDVHFEFPENILLKEAHERSHGIEKEILKIFPNAVILTHFDYCNDL